MEAAKAQLAGDVSPRRAGGSIRYRIWPARRRPVLAVLALVLIGAAAVGTWYGVGSVLYAAVVFIGCAAGAALAFFPTEVSLDGHQLNMRQLGTPRTWDLRRYRRMEIIGEPLPRVELRFRGRLSPVDPVRAVIVPLPSARGDADAVIDHLREWVGRQVTGRFEIDDDHAPEDSILEG